MPINQDQALTLNHNLGVPPEQLAVQLWFRDTDPAGIGIHRAYYGGIEISNTVSTWQGAYWRNLTPNTVTVHRMADDQKADQINVKVFVVSPPDYDSGWQTVAPGSSHTFNHNLGITDTELTVSMWFSHTTLGIHHFTYGGLTDGEEEHGAYWLRLTDTSVKVYRRPDDVYVEQVRVVVVHADPPAYDSLVALGGWQDIAPGTTFTFSHSLHWNPTLLLVRTECRDTTPGGAPNHQLWAGGDEWFGGLFRGAYLQKLTLNTVQLVRLANDQECDQARVVIYKRSASLYLPLILNNHTLP